MDTKGNEDADDEGGGKNDLFFIEDLGSSESEGEITFGHQKQSISCKAASRLSRESSPPLLLAFSITSGRAVQNSSLSVDLEEDEDSDQPIEEWMILGREEQLGDSNIQLNLSYWDNSEGDNEDEDQKEKSYVDTWAVSEKDKYGADQSLPMRYFVPGRFLNCNICNRTGHLAKSCYYHKPKCSTCILCGIQGHIHRDCPTRPCPTCGLPSHGLRPCERPPLWNQHCQRCGMAGHLSDACPDTWRQYHFTVRLDVPLRPPIYSVKHKKYPPHCYNCSERGHYGYECTKRRMISGTSASLPYVCHYDTMEDISQCRTEMQKRTKDVVSSGSVHDLQHCEPTEECGEENQTVQRRSKTKQETCSRAGRRKTWPERRRERREVKRLRREAQARREGGLLGRPWGNTDDEVCSAHPLGSSFHSLWQSAAPPQKKRRDEEGGRNRKKREAERWKKRGGIKLGDLYSYAEVDICSENHISPKQRVRHRRR